MRVFVLLALCSLSALAMDSRFQEEVVAFCPASSALSQAGVSALECAIACLERVGCCGVFYRPQSRVCRFLEDMSKNKRPVNAEAGPCRLFRRLGSKCCPQGFKVALPAAPRRLFYVHKQTVDRSDAPSFCAALGEHVAEEYPPLVFSQLAGELQKVFTEDVVKNKQLSCIDYGPYERYIYCHASSGLKRIGSWQWHWPRQGVMLDSRVYPLYEKLGYRVHKSNSDVRLMGLSFSRTSWKFVQPIIDRLSYNKFPVVPICECQYLEN